MSKLRINCFALSLEGYGAGPRQDLDNPLGVGGEKLHEWFLNGIDLVALGYRGRRLHRVGSSDPHPAHARRVADLAARSHFIGTAPAMWWLRIVGRSC